MAGYRIWLEVDGERVIDDIVVHDDGSAVLVITGIVMTDMDVRRAEDVREIQQNVLKSLEQKGEYETPFNPRGNHRKRNRIFAKKILFPGQRKH